MKYIVSYRDEFTAEIEANSIKEAIEKFGNIDNPVFANDNLYNEFYEVMEKDTEKTVKEYGW